MANDSKKISVVLTLTCGMAIFSGVILLKLEVWAYKVRVDVQQASAEADWNGFLYQKTVQDMMAQAAPTY